MQTHNPRTIEQLQRASTTKGKAFADYPHTVDCALPQPWLDAFADWCRSYRPKITYHLILSSTCWSYGNSCMGYPVTVCSEVSEAFDAWQGVPA